MDDQNLKKPLNGTISYSASDSDCRRVMPTDDAFNGQFARQESLLGPGDVRWLDDKSKMMVATLGAGIALTIYDEQLYFSTMAYSLIKPDMIKLFPSMDGVGPEIISQALQPIESAIAEMKKHGAGKNRIRIRLFGGANLPGDQIDSGTKNYIFVKEYLSRKNLGIMSEDIGGDKIRRIHLFPETGSVTRFELKRGADISALEKQENAYLNEI